MSPEISRQSYPSIESLAFDMSVFWLDPRSIAEVNDLINHTHLPTMSLGFETLPDEQRNISQRIAEVLIDAEGPQAVNLRRAVEVGYLYGRLISRKSLARNDQDVDVPEAAGRSVASANFIESLKKATVGIDVHSLYGGFKLFAAVRSVELGLAHSDILAFSLGASQEHMKQEFTRYDKTLDGMNMIRMQSLYYAGALAAALETSGHVVQFKQPAVVTRSMQLSKKTVALRLNFEDDDDLLKSLEQQMSSKVDYSFSPDSAEITPSGFQIGPNKRTLPDYSIDERQSLSEQFQASDIIAVFIKELTIDGPDRLIGITDYPSFVDSWLAKKFAAEVRPVGILVRGLGCIASFDSTHPNAAQLRQLAASITDKTPDQVAYRSTVQAKDFNPAQLKMPLRIILPNHVS